MENQTETNENIIECVESREALSRYILQASGLVAVSFVAEWCGPSRRLLELIRTLAAENGTVLFITVDLDKSPSIASNYETRTIPEVKFFKANNDGVLTSVGEIHGFDPAGMRDLIQRHK